MFSRKSDSNSNWEQKALANIALAAIKEQRASRRWKIFFRLMVLLFLFALLWPSLQEQLPAFGKQKKHVALIAVKGVISDHSEADAESINEGLDDAFKDPNTQAVILAIDSPGGSPVQASEVYNNVTRLRHNYPQKKIYAVCSDVCASAAYYIASGSNAIYANPMSLVGSIGVLMDGFGFVDTLQKLGVQRRLITAGSHKGFMDPFSPMSPADAAIAKGIVDNVHQQFIAAVEQGRGKRLKITADIFSGLAWTGSQALPMGLIDGFGSVDDVSREVIKNTNLVDYTVKPNVMDQLASRISGEFVRQVHTQLTTLRLQ